MLDVHLANACNLHCDGCNHWSNYNFKEIFSNEVLYKWAKPWAKRLSPERINLLGGEPLLNKECEQIISTYRELFPDSVIKLFTNGLLLSKQEWLYECLKRNNIVLVITFHSKNKVYKAKFKKELQFLQTWGKAKLIKETWFRKVYNIKKVEVEIRYMSGHWYKTYKGNGINAVPYTDNNPSKSWENCISKDSMQLYNGNLFKCGPIAYLNDFLDKYGLKNKSEWKSYSKYKGLTPNCTDNELNKFLKRKDEFICNMCPANPEKMNDKEIFKIKEK